MPATPLSPCHVALVPAAGIGQRFNLAPHPNTPILPKQYALLGQYPMLWHTVQALLATDFLDCVLVVVCAQDPWVQAALADLLQSYPKRLKLSFTGGSTRAATVQQGLSVLSDAGYDALTWVWVHDAARPAIKQAQLQSLKQALQTTAIGALLAVPVADTLKRVQSSNQSLPLPTLKVLDTVAREGIWQAQTPQCFGLANLQTALDHANTNSITITDEASAIELMGQAPVVVTGSPDNFKVTQRDDAALMCAILTMNLNNNNNNNNNNNISSINNINNNLNSDNPKIPKIAIGEGMDVHALVVGRPLILGGITIPHTKGLLGHSDADALLHAITDALLGAAGMGDIGRLFPDTHAAYAGANSQLLLTQAHHIVAQSGWQVMNVDATIIAQAPKMSPYIVAMQENIARCLHISSNQVNIKAKTNEKLGWLGREEGIETRAVLLLFKN